MSDTEPIMNPTPGFSEKRRQSAFMRACHLEPVPYTPVWLMRQAGRYMKEYADLRAKYKFMELCKNPELACQVAVHAALKIKSDAAILFSDILLPLEAMGMHVQFEKGEGPRLSPELDSSHAVKKLSVIEPREELGYVMDAIRLTRKSLPEEIPLIGFAGGPFTLACYAIEGGPTRVFDKTKRFMKHHPNTWQALLMRIAKVINRFLFAQIESGADVLQLFDTWAGILTPEEYREFAYPYTQSALSNLPVHVPVIHFGTHTRHLLSDMKDAGGRIIGIDHRISLHEAWKSIGYNHGIQGNLNPDFLHGSTNTIRQHVLDILHAAENRPGHIFNLGHGVMPNTPVEKVIELIDMVHTLSRR